MRIRTVPDVLVGSVVPDPASVVAGAHPARATAPKLSAASPARSRLTFVVKDMIAFLSFVGGDLFS
jgi:hypothetical protein